MVPDHQTSQPDPIATLRVHRRLDNTVELTRKDAEQCCARTHSCKCPRISYSIRLSSSSDGCRFASFSLLTGLILDQARNQPTGRAEPARRYHEGALVVFGQPPYALSMSCTTDPAAGEQPDERVTGRSDRKGHRKGPWRGVAIRTRGAQLVPRAFRRTPAVRNR